MARNQNPGALMNIEIGGKWTFIPPKYGKIGFDPSPYGKYYRKIQQTNIGNGDGPNGGYQRNYKRS
jgi:hypothetical protein